MASHIQRLEVVVPTWVNGHGTKSDEWVGEIEHIFQEKRVYYSKIQGSNGTEARRIRDAFKQAHGVEVDEYQENNQLLQPLHVALGGPLRCPRPPHPRPTQGAAGRSFVPPLQRGTRDNVRAFCARAPSPPSGT